MIECEINGEVYGYEMIYDDNFRIRAEGGDSFISSHVDTAGYDDANVLMAHIEDYFIEHGGTYTVVQDHVSVDSINE